jgi:Heparinase II/III N-terminus/Heparinase II/III-like protein
VSKLLRTVRAVWRSWGSRGFARRIRHELRVRSGRFQRHGSAPPPAGPRPPSALVIDRARLREIVDRQAARVRADRVAAGEFQAYRWDWRSLPDTADGWLTPPGARAAFPGAAPWWRVPHRAPEVGDIKDVWEPARFAWLYDLVRGYALTEDARYMEAFEAHLKSWMEAAPPFLGVHWACGQETAIRALALSFAEANLPLEEGSALAQSVERVLWWSGERIADAIGYGLSQRNNHGISEATGLIVLGYRFGGRSRVARQWLERGRALLLEMIDDQFYLDGWYAQHSFSYMRLALEQCAVAAVTLEAAGAPLPAWVRDRLGASCRLMAHAIDARSGRLPNHGAVDGSFVLPTSLAELSDYRAVLTLSAAISGVPVPEDIPLCEEPLAWLGLPAPKRGPARSDGVWIGGQTGWVVWRLGGGGGFTRAGRTRHRPSHLDRLHLELWSAEGPRVLDPGSYSYVERLTPDLEAAGAHNGPLVDGREPATRGPRFLWLDWPEGRVISADFHEDGRVEVVLEGGGVRRSVRADAHELRVEDAPLRKEARLTVRWLLGDEAVMSAEGTVESGWLSGSYGHKVPVPARIRTRRCTPDSPMVSDILLTFDSPGSTTGTT